MERVIDADQQLHAGIAPTARGTPSRWTTSTTSTTSGPRNTGRIKRRRRPRVRVPV
jgi:hypothetical protein